MRYDYDYVGKLWKAVKHKWTSLLGLYSGYHAKETVVSVAVIV